MIQVNKKILPKKIWVSYSSGVDSVASAHLLAVKMGFSVGLWHFNHKLRPQNDEMMQAMRRFSQEFNLPYEAQERFGFEGANSEAEWRDMRLGHMSQALPDGATVVMCHHLDDCVESYLMNCFNGQGHFVPIPIITQWGRVTMVRPFMLTKKQDLIDYVEENNLTEFVVEDETNADIKYRRNWVRHRARPTIEEHYPGIRKVVWRKMNAQYEALV